MITLQRRPRGAPVVDAEPSAPDRRGAIEVRHLTKRYGAATVVDDVSFTVAPGEAVALWGPNGAGKSTVIRCLLGSIAFEGMLSIAGHDVHREPKQARRRLGYVPQNLAFYDDLTAGETVQLSTRLRGVSLPHERDALGRVGLAEQWDKKVGALSGGMKQRLAIALALVADPPVLLLDEPTSSLDVAARESVLEVFDTLRDGHRTILLSSHHLDEVGGIADRVIAMDSGRLVLEAAPRDFAARLGLRVRLHLHVAPDQRERAAHVLRAQSFSPETRAEGIVVETEAGRNGRAIRALTDVGIDVLDVEVWR